MPAASSWSAWAALDPGAARLAGRLRRETRQQFPHRPLERCRRDPRPQFGDGRAQVRGRLPAGKRDRQRDIERELAGARRQVVAPQRGVGAAGLAQNRGVGQAFAAGGAGRLVDGQEPELLVDRAGGEFRGGTGEQALLRQIGRASCRERVLPTV